MKQTRNTLSEIKLPYCAYILAPSVHSVPQRLAFRCASCCCHVIAHIKSRLYVMNIW